MSEYLNNESVSTAFIAVNNAKYHHIQLIVLWFVLNPINDKSMIQIHINEYVVNWYHNSISAITKRGIVNTLRIENVDLSQCLIAISVTYDWVNSNNILIINKGILAVLKESSIFPAYILYSHIKRNTNTEKLLIITQTVT